ncbi:MAG TPA: M23 family metallopeptidase [Candidatus Competibacter sp.]|nr:M23 family metallopeptidase [Candidatus Competibacter sp.]HUM93091.1 M23 family metallopeptidase [Candidatus Competibacter sp.]
MMATFPLPFKPTLSYRQGGRRFGANRDGGDRKHAGCDLIAPKGTEIYAVESGVVATKPYLFYRGTYAIEFQLDSGKLVRYCEIEKLAPGIKKGSPVTEGNLIAYVGKMYVSSMLHFELYEGSASGPLTVRSNPPYQRRSDLIDPADYLDSCMLLGASSYPRGCAFGP